MSEEQELTQGLPESDSGEFEGSTVSSADVVSDADGEVVSGGHGDYVPEAASQQASQWQGLVEYARQQGVNLPYRDDASAAQALLNYYRQAQQPKAPNFYEQYGQQLAPYAGQIEQYLQQQRAQQYASTVRQPWQPPEWDDRWLQLVERDSNTGMVFSKAGVDPAIAQKVMEYAQWQEEYRRNPEKFIQPMIEQRAAQIVEQRFVQYQERQQADSIVQSNSNWMFAQHESGAPMLMQDGSRALSPAGRLYAQSVHQIWNSGVRNVNQCHQLALSVVQNAVLKQQYLMQQQAAQASLVPQQQLSQSGAHQGVGGSLARPAASPARGPRSNKGLSLREMLDRDLRGVSDNEAHF